jgi:hypothetical protein
MVPRPLPVVLFDVAGSCSGVVVVVVVGVVVVIVVVVKRTRHYIEQRLTTILPHRTQARYCLNGSRRASPVEIPTWI